MAVWHAWLPLRSLESMVDKLLVKLAEAKSVWQLVRGPAAAMIASARRLGWTVVNATELITDHVKTLAVALVSPAVVKAE